MRRAPAEAGYSLIEMAVAMAVVAVALFLAAGMLREAHVLAAANGRQLLDPLAGQLAARLRADVQGADGVVAAELSGLPGLWTGAPLCLADERGEGLLCWHPAGTELRRQALGVPGATSDVAWLTSLERWRWRQPAVGLLELEVSYWRAPDPSAWRLAGAPTPPPALLATERLRLALRGAGRGLAW